MKKINKVICGISQELFNKDFAGKYIVDADDLDTFYGYGTDKGWYFKNEKSDMCTHTMQGIKSSIQPIEVETAKDLLQELMTCLDSDELSLPVNFKERTKVILGRSE